MMLSVRKNVLIAFVVGFGMSSCQDDETALKAESLGASDRAPQVSSERAAALASFESQKGTDSKEEEEAITALIEVLDSEGDSEAVLQRAGESLGNKKFRFNRLEVRLFEARALDKLGRRDEAIVAFGLIADQNPGAVRYSTPSTRARCRLLWERNLPARAGAVSDRDEAYKSLIKYLKMTKPIFPKFTEEEKSDWNELSKSVGDFMPKGD